MKFKYHHIEMYKLDALLQTSEIDIYVEKAEDAKLSFLTRLDRWNKHSLKIKYWSA